MLSGSTDDSLLNIVAASCKDCNREAEFTAVDICATPLLIMEEFAARRDMHFSTVQADILAYSTEQRFDLIVTHAFLGYFEARERFRVLRKWASLLVEGGSIVTVQRVRPADSPALVRFSPGQAADFVASARSAAHRLGLSSPAQQERVQEAARSFSDNFTTHAITSRTELEHLFSEAGLQFRYLEYRSQETSGKLAGPSVPSGAEYAFIVAAKGPS